MDNFSSEKNFMLEGDNYFYNRNFELALQEYKKYLEYTEENEKILYRLGCVYSHLLDAELTQKYFTKTIKFQENSSEALICKNWIKEYETLKPNYKSKSALEVKFAKEEEKCFHHQEENAVYKCTNCNKNLCLMCIYPANSTYFCVGCIQKFKQTVFKPEKKEAVKIIQEKIDLTFYKKSIWFIIGFFIILALIYRFII